MRLSVQTFDRTLAGDLELDPAQAQRTTVAELLAVLQANLHLPPTTDYFLRSQRVGRQLDPEMTLGEADVQSGDTLEIAPILQAGR